MTIQIRPITPPTDVDSTPDNNVPSEDDQDDEPVNVGQVFDLALVKSLASGQATTVNAGDDVIFTIDVTNQGTLDAYNIEVTDRIPAGMSLSVNDANGWVASGTDATNNSITFLAAGEN